MQKLKALGGKRTNKLSFEVFPGPEDIKHWIWGDAARQTVPDEYRAFSALIMLVSYYFLVFVKNNFQLRSSIITTVITQVQW